MEILSSTRSTIRVAMNGRTITLSGEGMPLGNAVSFYADRASITSWEDGAPVSAEDRNEIIEQLPQVAERNGFALMVD